MGEVKHLELRTQRNPRNAKADGFLDCLKTNFRAQFSCVSLLPENSMRFAFHQILLPNTGKISAFHMAKSSSWLLNAKTFGIYQCRELGKSESLKM